MAPDSKLRSENRAALLGVYAALDTTEGDLARALREFGVEFDGELEPYSQLQKAAEDLDQQNYPIHRIHLAGAVMNVLRDPRFAPPKGSARDQLRPVVDQLVAPSYRGTDTVDEVYWLLKRASGADRFHERWAQVNTQPGEVSSPLDPSLSVIANSRVSIIQPQINTGLFSVKGEAVSRIETSFVVKRPDPDLKKIAPALLPHNWPRCGDFFCDLSRTPDRDRDVLGATDGDLSPTATHWRGVYQERVGGCSSGGWFPDTFLVFTWDYYPPNQLILRYELAPKRTNDRTRLKIDEGYIQVNRLHDGYEVSTLKYLLFDDKFISGGGQTIAGIAPQIGWLDQSINQFGRCAELLPGRVGLLPDSSGVGGSRDEIDAGLQEVLRSAEAHLQETATSADAQVGKIVSKIREGRYSLNDLVGDWGEAALRAMRDTSRALQGQIDFARESLELANEVFPRRRGTRS